MTKFTSYENFTQSDSELLNCVPTFVSMYNGTMYFKFEHNDEKYIMSGSQDSISDYEFTPGSTVKFCCDFDNFWLYKCDDEGYEAESICEW